MPSAAAATAAAGLPLMCGRLLAVVRRAAPPVDASLCVCVVTRGPWRRMAWWRGDCSLEQASGALCGTCTCVCVRAGWFAMLWCVHVSCGLRAPRTLYTRGLVACRRVTCGGCIAAGCAIAAPDAAGAAWLAALCNPLACASRSLCLVQCQLGLPCMLACLRRPRGCCLVRLHPHAAGPALAACGALPAFRAGRLISWA